MSRAEYTLPLTHSSDLNQTLVALPTLKNLTSVLLSSGRAQFKRSSFYVANWYLFAFVVLLASFYLGKQIFSDGYKHPFNTALS